MGDVGRPEDQLKQDGPRKDWAAGHNKATTTPPHLPEVSQLVHQGNDLLAGVGDELRLCDCRLHGAQVRRSAIIKITLLLTRASPKAHTPAAVKSATEIYLPR